MDLGARIRDLRIANKLTQSQLANKLNVTPQAVSRWEASAVEPSTDTIRKMAAIFSVSTDVIINFDDSQNLKNPSLDNPSLSSQEPKTAVTEVSVVGQCSVCGKTIQLGETYQSKPVYQRKGRRRIQTGINLICSGCQAKNEQLARRQTVITAKNQRNKGLGWGIAAGIISLIIGISYSISKGTDRGANIFYTMLISYSIFAFLFCLFAKNNFIGAMFLSIFNYGFVKMPGVIFSLSFEGLVFLVAAKIILAIISFIIVFIVGTFALILSLALSMFVFPFALNKSIKHPELTEI